MDNSLQNDSHNKKKYERVSYDNRLELIRLVQKEKSTIKNAAKLLEIKESTAKLIISRFRTCKTVYETKMDKSKRSQEGMKSIGQKKQSFCDNSQRPSAQSSQCEQDRTKRKEEDKNAKLIIPQPLFHNCCELQNQSLIPYFFYLF